MRARLLGWGWWAQVCKREVRPLGLVEARVDVLSRLSRRSLSFVAELGLWLLVSPGLASPPRGRTQAREEDASQATSDPVPILYMRQRLGENRSGDDDVLGGGVHQDGAILATASQDLSQGDPDLTLQRACLAVEHDRPAVQGHDQLFATLDRLLKEPTDRLDRGSFVAGSRPRVSEDEVERAMAQGCEEPLSRREMAVEGADSDVCRVGDLGHRHVLASRPDRQRGRDEQALAVRDGIAAPGSNGSRGSRRHDPDGRRCSATQAWVRGPSERRAPGRKGAGCRCHRNVRSKDRATTGIRRLVLA